MSDCSCIYIGDYGGPSFSKVSMVKARKTHKCCACGREILPREEYERTIGLWDGDFDTYKTCKDCLSVRDAFFCDGWCYETIWDDVASHICDLRGQISSDCLVNLTSRARAEVCELIEEQWDELEEMEAEDAKL